MRLAGKCDFQNVLFFAVPSSCVSYLFVLCLTFGWLTDWLTNRQTKRDHHHYHHRPRLYFVLAFSPIRRRMRLFDRSLPRTVCSFSGRSAEQAGCSRTAPRKYIIAWSAKEPSAFTALSISLKKEAEEKEARSFPRNRSLFSGRPQLTSRRLYFRSFIFRSFQQNLLNCLPI